MTSMKLLGRIGKRAAGASRDATATAPKTKIGYLTSSEIFRGLSQADMAEVDRMTTMTTCRRGRVFYTPGESGEVLFVLKRGSVQLYRISPDGKRLVIGTLGEGTVFGEMGMIGQAMCDSFAEAIEDCTLCVMSRSDVETLIASKPAFAVALLSQLGRRLVEVEAALERFAFGSVPSRLAALLLTLRDKDGEVRGMSHQDLADRIGTHRETATRCLNDFRSEGIIEAGRERIAIVDEPKLRAIAGES